MARLGSSLEVTAALVLPRLADGPKTLEELGVTRGVIRRLERNGLVRPSMLKILDAGGSVLGAIERWQTAKPKSTETMPRRRLDCAVLDFKAMGIG